MTFSVGLTVAELLVAIVFFIALAVSKGNCVNRNQAVLLSLFWITSITWWFWIAGSSSFALMNSELDYGLSIARLWTEHPGELWLPELAGGIDADSEVFSGQYLSLERALVGLMPLTAAYGVHKVLVAGIAVFGMYRLSRSFGAERLFALAAAGLYSLAHERMILMTWTHGLGFALPALFAWLAVGRQGRRWYWQGILACSVLTAVSSSPTHSMLAVGSAILAAAIFRGWASLPRALASLAILAVLSILNWHESFYAKMLLGPYSARGQAEMLTFLLHARPLYLFLAAGSLILLVLQRRSQDILRAASALAFVTFAGTLILFFCELVPLLAPLRPINFLNMQMAFPMLALLVASMAVAGLGTSCRLSSWSTSLVAAACIGSLVRIQLYVPLIWLSEGGMSGFHYVIRELQLAKWRPDEPVRLVSIPFRFPANTPIMAGFDTYDGGTALGLASGSAFWQAVVNPHAYDAVSGYVGLNLPDIDFKCCAEYRLSDFADVELLRLANVGFILSLVPLAGEEIVQVAGPNTGVPPRNQGPYFERLSSYFKELLHPQGLRVYRLDKPLPRAFAAQGIVLAGQGLQRESYFDLVKTSMSHGNIVIMQAAAEELRVAGKIDVLEFRRIPDGVELAVAADEDGIVVLNVQWLPFWKATADGKQVDLFPVNGIHMAAAISAGTRTVEFRYSRPRLRDQIVKAIFP